MSVKLRLRRMGRKKLPIWGLVAADARSPRDGRFIEDLGRYEPVQEPALVKIDHERAVYWLLQGAQPSDTVRDLLQRDGVLLRAAMTRKGAEAEAIETAVAEFKERQAARDATKKAKPTTAERRQKALDAERETAKERAAELAAQKAELEANLAKQREEAEAAERAEREAALAAAEAVDTDPEGAGETAGNAPASATADGDTHVEAVQKGISDSGTGNDAPIEDAAPEAAAEQKVAELQAGDASQADVLADEAETAVAEAEEEVSAETTDAEAAADETPAADASDDATAKAAPAEDAATAEAETEATDADDVSDEAPDAAEEQPAVEEDTTEEVAADTGEAVADQADAGAKGEPEAPKGADAAEADKLTDLWGVGPKYAGILTDAGVTTFAQVAAKSVEELQAIITDAGSTTAGNEETWAKQAQLLADGDTAGHDAYVEELKNA